MTRQESAVKAWRQRRGARCHEHPSAFAVFMCLSLITFLFVRVYGCVRVRAGACARGRACACVCARACMRVGAWVRGCAQARVWLRGCVLVGACAWMDGRVRGADQALELVLVGDLQLRHVHRQLVEVGQGELVEDASGLLPGRPRQRGEGGEGGVAGALARSASASGVLRAEAASSAGGKPHTRSAHARHPLPTLCAAQITECV
jgi:hypothetical protein